MKIAVLSRKSSLYSTRRLIEAARERGHEAQVINHAKCYMALEGTNPHIYVGDHMIEDLDAIIPRIGASITFYGSSIIRQFEMQNVFTTLSSLALMRSRDKLRSLQILTRAGIETPRTAFAKYPGDIKNLIKLIGGAPLVIKLLESTQGKGVVLAETQKAAQSVIEAFYGLEANIIVQEFIKEARAEDIRAFVVDGKVVGAMKRTGQKGEFRSNLHKGGVAQAVKLTRLEASRAVKAAKALNLNIAGVDMLRSDRGPLVIEVNSSPGLEGIEKATGNNIAGEIIQYIERNINQSGRKHKDKVGV
ncbi:MAG: 30S ribosomal protein S6--L-glutamate ligase [Flavobacteriales bacterium]|nr:30S ribosomal protein S6--L-glutamate ligase [Flavobacteriales bacterium]